MTAAKGTEKETRKGRKKKIKLIDYRNVDNRSTGKSIIRPTNFFFFFKTQKQQRDSRSTKQNKKKKGSPNANKKSDQIEADGDFICLSSTNTNLNLRKSYLIVENCGVNDSELR